MLKKYVVILEVEDEASLDPDEIRNHLYREGERLPFSFEVTSLDDPEERRERAREQARAMLGGLMPGNTGNNMAVEVADKILAAIDGKTGR